LHPSMLGSTLVIC